MKTRHIGFAAAAVLVTGLAAMLTAPSLAEQPPAGPPGTPAKHEYVWPERLSNAKVLPANFGAERLRGTMVSFARALGVRCTFCHVGPEGAPLTELDFVSDANPRKEVARGMMRMTRRLNQDDLTAILGASEGQRVSCHTCHRGSATPETALPPRPAAPQPTPASGQ